MSPGVDKVNEQCFNNRVARPRTISDERLLAATGAVIARNGPSFTVADVAVEAGVSVGTIAGRFGSKHGLLCALSAAGVESLVGVMRDAAAKADAPLAGLRDALVAAYAGLGDAATAANHLGQLGVDLTDPELRRLLGELYAAMEREIRALVRAAVAALPGAPPPRRAARVLQSLIGGIALDWSIRPHGRLVDRLRQDIDAVLDGWKRAEGTGRAR